MQMWEYRTVQKWKQAVAYDWASGMVDSLNEMGRQGWELVAVLEREGQHSAQWVFKRPVRTAVPESWMAPLERTAW